MLLVGDNVYTEIYYVSLIIAGVFFVIANLNINNQIAIVAVLILVIYIIYYLQHLSLDKQTNQDNLIKKFDKDIDDREFTSDNLFSLNKFPKNMKYLKENTYFIDMMRRLVFVKKMDASRYGDLLINLNLLMKIYIYILSERYDPDVGLPIFIDTRDNILDLLYSLIMVVPSKFKHIYDVNPHERIDETIKHFTIKSREMLEILERFSTIHKNKYYIPDTKYKPFNQIRPLYFI